MAGETIEHKINCHIMTKVIETICMAERKVRQEWVKYSDINIDISQINNKLNIGKNFIQQNTKFDFMSLLGKKEKWDCNCNLFIPGK